MQVTFTHRPDLESPYKTGRHGKPLKVYQVELDGAPVGLVAQKKETAYSGQMTDRIRNPNGMRISWGWTASLDSTFGIAGQYGESSRQRATEMLIRSLS